MFFDHLPGSGYVCAHRGARDLAPENTMLAAQYAVELGADFWELDVHRIADGSLIVFHDDVLDRTTDVASRAEFASRKPWPIHEFTRTELDALDAGSWFGEKDPYGTIARGAVSEDQLEQMQGARVPSLREALEFTRRHGLPMNLEIKDQQHAPGDMTIVGDVLHLIREVGVEDLILISSFNHEYLKEMRRIAPDMPLAALVEDDHPANLVAYLKGLSVVAYHPNWEIVDADLVRRLGAEGIKVSPYTVNDMDTALNLINAGCFGIITDHTHSLRLALEK